MIRRSGPPRPNVPGMAAATAAFGEQRLRGACRDQRDGVDRARLVRFRAERYVLDEIDGDGRVNRAAARP